MLGDDLTYKGLRDLLRGEKSQPGLVRLPPEYYSSVEAFLASSFSQTEATRSVLSMREFENSTAVIREIALLRQQKILFKAIRNGGVHGEVEEMTREEHELYDRFCNIIEDENGRMSRILGRFEHRKNSAEKQPSRAILDSNGLQTGVRLKKVRFIKEVHAYIGANKEKFGPYKAGDEGTLPPDEAELLLKEKLAELVE